MSASTPNRKTLLRGGLIVDGTGGPSRPGSILLDGGRIAAVGDLPNDAGTPINCAGRVIAPGFIDAHSHMDFFAASEDPHHFDPFTAQGVTTFVAGNCGFSPFGFAQYKPGVFAKLDELDDVARLVKRHDKLLTVHAKACSSFSGTYPMIPFGRAHNLKAIEPSTTGWTFVSTCFSTVAAQHY